LKRRQIHDTQESVHTASITNDSIRKWLDNVLNKPISLGILTLFLFWARRRHFPQAAVSP
jgi:hypothetical protein